MSISQDWKRIAVLLAPLVVMACGPAFSIGLARADEKVDSADTEVRDLVRFLNNKGFYDLRNVKEKEAIAKLQKISERAAPAVAEMLAEGLKNRKSGWIEVYRPLYILKGMGEHAKVALADIIKALDDEHLINVGAAARVLENIGPAAKDALPSLQRRWESLSFKDSNFAKKAIGSAIEKIDPKAAANLRVK